MSDDLMLDVHAALGEVPPLHDERHPLPTEVAARFRVYLEAQRKRADESRQAKAQFFAYLKEQMPDLAGKPIQLNDDGTYQFFADFRPAANEQEQPHE